MLGFFLSATSLITDYVCCIKSLLNFLCLLNKIVWVFILNTGDWDPFLIDVNGDCYPAVLLLLTDEWEPTLI